MDAYLLLMMKVGRSSIQTTSGCSASQAHTASSCATSTTTTTLLVLAHRMVKEEGGTTLRRSRCHDISVLANVPRVSFVTATCTSNVAVAPAAALT